jgi:hypothetical protein
VIVLIVGIWMLILNTKQTKIENRGMNNGRSN